MPHCVDRILFLTLVPLCMLDGAEGILVVAPFARCVDTLGSDLGSFLSGLFTSVLYGTGSNVTSDIVILASHTARLLCRYVLK